jgi:hypothetical protein
MKFLCVGYYDQDRMDALSKAEVEAAMSECPAFIEEMYATGQVFLVAGTDQEATTLRRVGGEARATGGAKEGRHRMVGCVFLVEANDMDDAVRVASLHPTTRVDAGEKLGWHIGVSAVHYFDERELKIPSGAAPH